MNGEPSDINYKGGYMADILMATKGLYIKERTDLMEVVTGYDRENVYDIMDIEAKRGAILF